MSQTIQLRQENPTEEEKMANLEHPDNDVYGYLARGAADEVGEYLSITVADGDGVEANLSKTTKNFAVYETPGGGVVSLGIRKSIIEDVFGIDFEDEDAEAPPTVGLAFASSDEDAWEEAEGVDEDELEALVASDTDSEDSDEAEEVEISDEELDLVAE